MAVARREPAEGISEAFAAPQSLAEATDQFGWYEETSPTLLRGRGRGPEKAPEAEAYEDLCPELG
jgi:hypothetical protein